MRKNKTHNDIINDYLIENDCKLQYYYTDIELNLTNKKDPFSSFLNSFHSDIDYSIDEPPVTIQQAIMAEIMAPGNTVFVFL